MRCRVGWYNVKRRLEGGIFSLFQVVNSLVLLFTFPSLFPRFEGWTLAIATDGVDWRPTCGNIRYNSFYITKISLNVKLDTDPRGSLEAICSLAKEPCHSRSLWSDDTSSQDDEAIGSLVVHFRVFIKAYIVCCSACVRT